MNLTFAVLVVIRIEVLNRSPDIGRPMSYGLPSPPSAYRAFAMANSGGVPHRLEPVTAYAAGTTASARSTDPLLARIRRVARVRHRNSHSFCAALRVGLCSFGAITGTGAAANASSPIEIVADPEALTSRTGGIGPTPLEAGCTSSLGRKHSSQRSSRQTNLKTVFPMYRTRTIFAHLMLGVGAAGVLATGADHLYEYTATGFSPSQRSARSSC